MWGSGDDHDADLWLAGDAAVSERGSYHEPREDDLGCLGRYGPRGSVSPSHLASVGAPDGKTRDSALSAAMIRGHVASSDTVCDRGTDVEGEDPNMQVNQLIAGISVGDLDRSIVWYGTLFGRSADSRPMKEVAERNVVPSGVVRLVSDPKRAGTSHLSLVVSDLERTIADISALVEAPRRVEGGDFRTATVDDPDRNEITFVEVQPAATPTAA
jgi:hypothetical protein